MKKGCLVLLLLLSVFCVKAQSLYYPDQIDMVNFENSPRIQKYILLDTNNGNIWRIGKPDKPKFNSAYSFNNTIVTDLNGYYPPKSNSSFIMKFFGKHELPNYNEYLKIGLEGYYKIDSDTITDYGLIEMSPNNGLFWIDITHDTNAYWVIDEEKKEPIFTGDLKDKWHYFHFITNALIAFNSTGLDSTLWFRFSFISDSIDNKKEGWIIDDLKITIYFPGDIDENELNNVLNIAPNPVNLNDDIKISFKTEAPEFLNLYNSQGKLLKQITKPQAPLTIKTTRLQKGLFFVKVIDKHGQSTVKKLIID